MCERRIEDNLCEHTWKPVRYFVIALRSETFEVLPDVVASSLMMCLLEWNGVSHTCVLAEPLRLFEWLISHLCCGRTTSFDSVDVRIAWYVCLVCVPGLCVSLNHIAWVHVFPDFCFLFWILCLNWSNRFNDISSDQLEGMFEQCLNCVQCVRGNKIQTTYSEAFCIFISWNSHIKYYFEPTNPPPQPCMRAISSKANPNTLIRVFAQLINQWIDP